MDCSCSLSFLPSLISHLLATKGEEDGEGGMRRVRCASPPSLLGRDILTIDFTSCTEEEEEGEGLEARLHLIIVVVVAVVVLGIFTTVVVLLMRRRCSSSSTTSTLYQALPYPGDVRRRGEEGDTTSSSTPSSLPLLL